MTSPQATGVSPSPWSARQRLTLGVLQALGVAGLVAGYAGTSGTLRLSRQVTWINVAGVALLVSGVGIVAFLTAGRQAIGRRRLGIFGNVADPAAGRAAAPAGLSAGDLVAAPTMTKYHQAACSFVADKEGLLAASAGGHRQAGRLPCGVCLPGGEP